MGRKRRNPDAWFPCPHCGAQVPQGATFCRACGATEESGWGPDDYQEDYPAGYGGEDDFDYADYLRREFPDHADRRESVSLKVALFTLAAVLAALGLLLASLGLW